MEIKSFNSMESTFLSKFNEGFKTFETLKENVPFNESTLNTVIESLIAKNIIIFDAKIQEYKYDSPVDGDKVILDGNLMLPTTVIINKAKEKMLVSRGMWYEFPLDFDIRRIIWNVQLPGKSSSTLIDLIKESTLKVRKSKIQQLPEYQNLVDKLVPWNETIMLHINAVGETNTDVSIIFREKLQMDDDKDMVVEFRDFSVRSEISTKDLIDQLTCKIEDRKFSDIKLNRIFNFSEFIFSNNSIPCNNNGQSIEYVKITGIKNKVELTYFDFDNKGTSKKLTTETYLDVSEGISKLRELFMGYAATMLINLDFLIESND